MERKLTGTLTFARTSILIKYKPISTYRTSIADTITAIYRFSPSLHAPDWTNWLNTFTSQWILAKLTLIQAFRFFFNRQNTITQLFAPYVACFTLSHDIALTSAPIRNAVVDVAAVTGVFTSLLGWAATVELIAAAPIPAKILCAHGWLRALAVVLVQRCARGTILWDTDQNEGTVAAVLIRAIAHIAEFHWWVWVRYR